MLSKNDDFFVDDSVVVLIMLGWVVVDISVVYFEEDVVNCSLIDDSSKFISSRSRNCLMVYNLFRVCFNKKKLHNSYFYHFMDILIRHRMLLGFMMIITKILNKLILQQLIYYPIFSTIFNSLKISTYIKVRIISSYIS